LSVLTGSSDLVLLQDVDRFRVLKVLGSAFKGSRFSRFWVQRSKVQGSQGSGFSVQRFRVLKVLGSAFKGSGLKTNRRIAEY